MSREKEPQKSDLTIRHSREQATQVAPQTWSERIDTALQTDQFVLHMQPILDLRRDQTAGYEGLLRMVDVDGSLIPPGAFLREAERTGRMQLIDRWVVHRAIKILADQKRRGSRFRLSVNLSGRAFTDAELLPHIIGALNSERIDPTGLILEITETEAIPDLDEAKRFMQELRGVGFQFAIDDFGAGFSSISYLKHLPVDYVKIDGSFIRNLAHDPVDQELTRALVEVARVLGKQTVAEFVGDAQTIGILKAYGVDFAQGYFIGPPGPLV